VNLVLLTILERLAEATPEVILQYTTELDLVSKIIETLSISRTNGFVVRLAEIIAKYVAVEDEALAAFVASPLQDKLVRVCLPASRDSSDSE
jgi:hypothetical protein